MTATSNGSKHSLPNTSGGRCVTHNMRLAVTVCRAGSNCIKDDTLCKTPKGSEKKETTTTSTTGVPTTTMTKSSVVSKTRAPTTKSTDTVNVPQVKVLPRQGNIFVFLNF